MLWLPSKQVIACYVVTSELWRKTPVSVSERQVISTSVIRYILSINSDLQQFISIIYMSMLSSTFIFEVRSG